MIKHGQVQRLLMPLFLALTIFGLTGQPLQAIGPGTGGSKVRVNDEDIGPYTLLVATSPLPVTAGQMNVWVRVTGTEDQKLRRDAVVMIKAGKLQQKKELRLSDGYEGSNEPILHFGLGSALSVEEVTIVWPSGLEERLTELPARKLYRVKEGTGCLP